MKQFDSVSIKNRLVRRLQDKENWKLLIQDSALDSLLTVIAESEAEDMRYAEYIFREHTWSMSQNISSVVEASKYLGYNPKRKVSAIGYVYVSTDPSLSDLEVLDSEVLNTYNKPINNITISNNTSIGTLHFTTELATLTTADSYIMIPVIQGIKKQILIGENTSGLPFQEIKINVSNCEAASDDISRPYFTVSYTTPGRGFVSCTVVDSIFLADANTDACEITNYFDENTERDYFILKFGNNVSGRIPPANSEITLSYIESLGLSGNKENIGDINTTLLNGATTLYIKNLSAITGGREREALEEIRANAPKQYLVEGSIITANQYKKAIEDLPSIYKASVYRDLDENDQAYVAFSAIKEDGTSPVKEEIEEALLDRISEDKSPMDSISFITPDFINISYFFKVQNISLATLDNSNLKTDITDFIYEKYGILSKEFSSVVNSNEINTQTSYNFLSSAGNSRHFLLAKEKITTYTYNSGSQQFILNFSFNPSFSKILVDEALPFYMRINIYWTCPELETHDRTLFLVHNPAYDNDNQLTPYLVKQFGNIPIIIDKANKDAFFNETLGYDEITSGDDKILFVVELDMETNFLDTSLKIPEDYWNTSTEEGCLSINAYAYPEAYINNDIVPLNKNSIINLEKDDILVEVE